MIWFFFLLLTLIGSGFIGWNLRWIRDLIRSGTCTFSDGPFGNTLKWFAGVDRAGAGAGGTGARASKLVGAGAGTGASVSGGTGSGSVQVNAPGVKGGTSGTNVGGSIGSGGSVGTGGNISGTASGTANTGGNINTGGSVNVGGNAGGSVSGSKLGSAGTAAAVTGAAGAAGLAATGGLGKIKGWFSGSGQDAALDPLNRTYPPSAEMAASAHVNAETYNAMYARSVNDNEGFWAEQAKTRLDWDKPFTKVKNVNYQHPNVSIKWFEDGELNVCANCVDRHVKTRGNQTAIIWEADDPNEPSKHITYSELKDEVSKLANVLKFLGVKKGDRVILYMPMIPEAACAMLACARIGAVHSVVFGGFSADALASRIEDCGASLVITADEAPRGGKNTPLKANADKALERSDGVQMLVVGRTGGGPDMKDGRDHSYESLMAAASPNCPPEPMNAEDPLFILYTSGSTGKPKGVLHTTGGYILYAAMTHQLTFDYHDGDVYWCTADIGWVTGHSYIVYGPLANGAKTLMFEGVPTYPDASRFWQVCDKHKVNQFYTAPTAIRALMGQGDEFVSKCDLSSLRILGTVGEPINPEAWNWYNDVVGKGRCPIVDTFWQTENGGHLLTPLPGATTTKPGSATFPFFGIKPAVLDPQSGAEITETKAEGVLAISDSWPGQMRTVYGDHQRFMDTYFQQYKGYYFTGDGCRRDEDGYYWITGRVDDVLNVSGHRMGTAEVESALVAHPKVSEAAVVGYPHEIKGQGIYSYVTLMSGEEPSDELRTELQNWVRKEIGPIAKPDLIQWAPGLPKTRSGKIMRRILRKIAENDHGALGDTSTLADPAVVDDLVANRQNRA